PRCRHEAHAPGGERNIAAIGRSVRVQGAEARGPKPDPAQCYPGTDHGGRPTSLHVDPLAHADHLAVAVIVRGEDRVRAGQSDRHDERRETDASPGEPPPEPAVQAVLK